MIGDFLYALTPRDSASQGIEIYHRQQAQNAASILFEFEFTVPQGRVLMAQRAWLEALPGLVQKFDAATLYLYEGAVPIQVLWRATKSSVSAGGSGHLFWPNTMDGPFGWTIDLHGILLEGNLKLLFQTTFNVGGVANDVTVSLNGLLIPRGNLVI